MFVNINIRTYTIIGNSNHCFLFLFEREWMEGPWGTMDPDKVENETGNFWRSLYKLEKQFSEVPAAQKIATRVRVVHFTSKDI